MVSVPQPGMASRLGETWRSRSPIRLDNGLVASASRVMSASSSRGQLSYDARNGVQEGPQQFAVRGESREPVLEPGMDRARGHTAAAG